jgi:hypothetical protein
MFCSSLLFRFQSQVEHIEHDERVQQKHSQSKPSGVSNEVRRLEGDVDTACDGGHPFRPRQGIPKSASLDEAQNYVDARHQSDLPKPDVADARNQIDKHSYLVVLGADMQELQEALSDSPDISMPHRKQTKAGQNHDDSLREFNGGNRA